MTNPILEDLRTELDDFRAMVQHLRVQANLGAKEARAKLNDLDDRFEPAYLRARDKLSELAHDGAGEARTLAKSLQAGWDEVRKTHRELSKEAQEKQAE
jgi:hypothetical protein